MVEMILLGAAVLCGAAAAAERHRRRRMCQRLDEMLDSILDREKIKLSDLQEGELSAWANKMIRIQEMLEHEIQQATKEKEQVKGLISNMSHQLKTPLSSVMMYRDLLEEEVTGERQREFLEKMRQQMERIDWILGSLFKMVRLEQGSIQFNAGKASLKETLLLAVNTVYEKAEKKKIQIVTEPFGDCLLLHHSKWTAEVFSNILENGIKYSDEGSVIEIQVRPMELFTEIRFKDQGIGIRREELTEIFQRFYRSRDVEKKEGSGIGLYLSRLILEKEKGYMTVSSEYGRGSVFSIFLQNCQN